MKKEYLIKILRELIEEPGLSQRELAEKSGLSLGTVNRSIQYARSRGYLQELDPRLPRVTPGGLEYMEPARVKNAIILAAGFGSRCVPLTYETPKGLLAVKGTPMLERQIEQLLDKGIRDITIVVGYMKESFDYLIDRYGVSLIYNPDYAVMNNYASLYHAAHLLDNSYVLVADNWMEENIFNAYEGESWYSCLYFAGETHEWCVRTQASGRIRRIEIGGADSLALVGPAYFSREFSEVFRGLLRDYYGQARASDFYWEHLLKENLNLLPIYCNEQTGNVHEFENLEELRAYDDSYRTDTRNRIMAYFARQYQVPEGEIHGIKPMKEGLTNQSFKFSIRGEDYVFRLPGEGTEQLINRAHEKASYDLLSPYDLTDEVISFDAESGNRITRYYAGARVADPFNNRDLKASMDLVRKVHDLKLQVDYRFDIREMIDYYEGLVRGIGAMHFRDFPEVREKAVGLLDLRDRLAVPEVLCHGDYLYANVLFLESGEVRLIDWEYSGMADPFMDVAMYAIFSEFDRERIDLALRFYLDREPLDEEWLRLYLYVALGGFLWSMWGAFKQGLGLELGDYPRIMYRYMKDYYKLVEELEPGLS